MPFHGGRRVDRTSRWIFGVNAASSLPGQTDVRTIERNVDDAEAWQLAPLRKVQELLTTLQPECAPLVPSDDSAVGLAPWLSTSFGDPPVCIQHAGAAGAGLFCTRDVKVRPPCHPTSNHD